MDKRGRPKRSGGDFVHSLVKAGLAGIPSLGGSTAEIFSLIIVPPLSKRRDEWVESIAEGLNLLEEKVEGFKIEELANNDVFITTVAHATQAAIRNHQEEKLEALRNAVLNAALGNAPEEDMWLMFLDYVDSLTPWHLAILKFFDNPKEWGQKHGVSFSNYHIGSPSKILEEAFKDLRDKSELYDLFVKDLFSRGLMNTESLRTTMTESGIFTSRTTYIGQQFIKFITSPISESG